MEKMLKLAETYEYNNDFKNALGVYIRIQSNEPHILNKIGMCYFRLNKFEMAIKNFEKILPLLKNPIPDLLNNIGFCYSKIRDYETALKYYTQSNNIKQNINNEWLKSYMLDDDEDQNKYLIELNTITPKTNDLDNLKERLISQEVNKQNEGN